VENGGFGAYGERGKIIHLGGKIKDWSETNEIKVLTGPLSLARSTIGKRREAAVTKPGPSKYAGEERYEIPYIHKRDRAKAKGGMAQTGEDR